MEGGSCVLPGLPRRARGGVAALGLNRALFKASQPTFILATSHRTVPEYNQKYL